MVERGRIAIAARESRSRFGAAVRRRRMQLGLTQAQVWQALDMHQTTYSELELGRTRTFPPPDLIQELAVLLETTSEELLRDAGYIVPEEAQQPEYAFTAMLSYTAKLPVDDDLKEHIAEAVRFAENRWKKERAAS